MEKYLLYIKNNVIDGWAKVISPRNISVTPPSKEHLAISVEPDVLNNVNRLIGSIISLKDSVKDTKKSTDNCKHYSSLSVNYKPDTFTNWKFKNGEWIDADIDNTSLVDLKSNYIQEINSFIGLARKKYATSISGQDVIYYNKLKEAEAYQDGDDLNKYPYLEAESEVTNKSIEDVINSILKASRKTTKEFVEIEKVRMKAIRDITKSVSKKQVKDKRDEWVATIQEL